MRSGFPLFKPLQVQNLRCSSPLSATKPLSSTRLLSTPPMASPTNRVSAASACPPWSSLEGKVVMVTGASSGIGREISLDLARAGCRVVVAARRLDQLKALCDEINGSDSATPTLQAVGVWLDLSKEEGIIAEAVRRAWDSFGRIDALVNNAGIRERTHSMNFVQYPMRNLSVVVGIMHGAGGIGWLATLPVCTVCLFCNFCLAGTDSMSGVSATCHTVGRFRFVTEDRS